MLKLHTQRVDTGKSLKIVVDQIGSPTATITLANACWRLIQKVQDGNSILPVLHWSDCGVASWYDFALAIGEIGENLGLIKQAASVEPITTSQFPTMAKRPAYSVLDTSQTRDLLGMDGIHWREVLRQVLWEIKNSRDNESQCV